MLRGSNQLATGRDIAIAMGCIVAMQGDLEQCKIKERTHNLIKGCPERCWAPGGSWLAKVSCGSTSGPSRRESCCTPGVWAVWAVWRVWC